MSKRSVWLVVMPFLSLLLFIGLMGGFTVMWWCTLGGMLSGGLLVADILGRTVKPPKRSTPKHAAPTGHDPRRLAQDALDHAAKAADLGLPTGEWTDLAAFWTTWADQQDTVKAAETPAQRPTPPKGPGANPPAEFGRKAAATITAMPVVRAYSTPSDAFYVHIPGHCVETFKVPPTTYRQRTDLVVINGEDCVEYRESFVAPAPGDTLLARVVMPPNTSTVQQAQITDLRALGTTARTHEVEGDNGEVRTVDDNGVTVSVRRPIIDTHRAYPGDWDWLGLDKQRTTLGPRASSVAKFMDAVNRHEYERRNGD